MSKHDEIRCIVGFIVKSRGKAVIDYNISIHCYLVVCLRITVYRVCQN